MRSRRLYFERVAGGGGLIMTLKTVGRTAGSHLDDLPGLHGQRGEVPAAVDGDALSQDGVQAPHLIPRQHADPPTLLRRITGGHDDPTERSGGGCPQGVRAVVRTAAARAQRNPARESRWSFRVTVDDESGSESVSLF